MRAVLMSGVWIAVMAAAAMAQTPATPPVPVESPAQWIHADDYPPASMRMGEEGRVSVQLAVDAGGMVTGCTVTNSSGHPLLDARTCTILTQRARFQPARNASGQAVAGTTPVMSLRWQLPPGASASIALPSPPSSAADAKLMQGGTAFFQTLGGAPLAADRPLTPNRISLAKAMTQVVTPGTEQQMESIGRSLIEERFAKIVAGLPSRAQALAKADLAAAYDVAWQDARLRNLDWLAHYYAARLSDDEMHEVVDFFSSGIGYRNIHHDGEWTPADRQAFGKAAFERPALAKWTSADRHSGFPNGLNADS